MTSVVDRRFSVNITLGQSSHDHMKHINECNKQLKKSSVNTEFSKEVCHHRCQADCGFYLDGLDILLAGISLHSPLCRSLNYKVWHTGFEDVSRQLSISYTLSDFNECRCETPGKCLWQPLIVHLAAQQINCSYHRTTESGKRQTGCWHVIANFVFCACVCVCMASDTVE